MILVRRWGLGLAGGLVAGWACGSGAFDCTQATDCQGGGEAGECVAGFCAFPDQTCDSGLRYGEHSGPLSGTCVEPGDASTGEPPTTDDDPTQPTATSSTGTTGTGPTSADTGPMVDSSDEGPQPGDIEFTDDALEGEFGDGTFLGTEWRGDRLTLEIGGAQGQFTSRVYDAGTDAIWDSLQWWPDAPYGRRLPDGAQTESAYPEGNVDMQGNVLLMHFDVGGLVSDGDVVPDASGAGSDGQLISDGGPVQLVPGIFGNALDDHLASRISIPTALAPGLSFGDGDFSWSMWFRFDHACTSNNVYMGVDNAEGSDPNPHLWLGCTDDQWDECSGNVSAPRAGGVFRSVHNDSNDGVFFCSSSSVRSGQWHHVLVTKQGHVNAEVRLMVDGVVEHTAVGSFAGPNDYPDDPDFTIGAFSRGTYPSEGVLDEVAIWDRALSEGEALQVYRRGVSRLEVSVRVCAQPDCADEPPWTEGFVDIHDGPGPGGMHGLSGLPIGRYVQYRLRMDGDPGLQLPGPALSAVTILGHT